MKKAFFQSFEDSSDRDAGPDRLLLLQAELKKKKLLGSPKRGGLVSMISIG